MQGYSIFVVRGEWPRPYGERDSGGFQTHWYKSSLLKSRAETYPKELQAQVHRSNAGKSNTSQYERDMQLAMQHSRVDAPSSGGGGGGGFFSPRSEDMQMALALSMSHAQDDEKSKVTDATYQPTTTTTSTSQAMDIDGDEEDEEALLAKAKAMSMEEEKIPSIPGDDVDASELCEICLVLPNTRKLVKRKFLRVNTLEQLSAWSNTEVTRLWPFVFFVLLLISTFRRIFVGINWSLYRLPI